MGEVFQFLNLDGAKKDGLVFERCDPSRLRNWGLVVRTAKRTCGATGFKAYAWRAVKPEDAQPVAVRSPEKKLTDLIEVVRDVIQNNGPFRVSPEVVSELATAIGEAMNP